jgi:hypothetical protein
MITQKLPVPCMSQILGKYTTSCCCSWCCQRRHVEWSRDHSRYAEPEDVTIPYDPNLTVTLMVECQS